MEEEMDISNEEDNAKARQEASDDSEEEEMKSETEQTEQTEKIDESDSDDDEDAGEAEVKSLQTSLGTNPYDYASHVALIEKLRAMGELDRLRVARENMSNIYPLSPELWLSWMRDEMKLATTAKQKAEVVKLCERAVKDYTSVPVWLEYLQFSIGNMDVDKNAAKGVRELFERALTAVGLNSFKGAIIWEAFREFETVLLTMIDTANVAERKEQLGIIGNLFRRQLACPLLDMEKTYEEYQAWRVGDGAEADVDDQIVLRGYNKACEKLKLLAPYEDKIYSAHGESELLDAYKGYLLYEKQNRDPGRVTVLYERAVTDLSLDVSIWLDYLTYLEDTLKIESVLDPVYQRASRNIPWCPKVWQKWIRSCERWKRLVLEVQKLLENALSIGFSTAEDYRNLWMTYLEYLRRSIDECSGDEKKKRLDIMRNAFNRACEHLAKYFGLDGDPECVILQYWARTEAIHMNDMEKFRTLWADILSQGHSASASYWLEYISLERCYGDTKHLRKLFQKALTSTKDWPEGIAKVWIDFERDEGDLEQMELCETKTKESIDKITKERQKAQQVSIQSETQDKRASKRKADDVGRWQNLGVSTSKIVKSEDWATHVHNKSRNLDKTKNKSPEKSKPEMAPPPGYKTKEDKNADKDNQHEVDNDMSVFVSNLDYTATENDIRDALKSVGPITLFKMVKDFKGRSKGYCYVQLSNVEAVKEALKLDRTSINGRPMFVSKCDPNKSTRVSGFKYSSTMEQNKLFVKGLSVTTTKEELEEIFKAYGDLKEVRVVTFRNGHSKGIAYVEYYDEASAARALSGAALMKIQDKVISVAISKPPLRKTDQTTEESKDQIESQNVITVNRTTRLPQHSAPKTLLSMIPRNVKVSNSNGTAAPSGSGIAQSMSNQDFRNMLLNKK